MKSYKQFLEDTSTQQCPEGKYFCHKEKKCMPIPRGYYVGAKGWLKPEENKKNGSNNGNGNGNGHSGNGNGGNGNGGGGNGGGGE